MLYLILIAIALVLFGAFLLLTALERSRGFRILGTIRKRLDARVSRIAFVLSHVDWSAFIKHLVTSVLERIAHDSAHTVLLVVRFIERLLTRAVRYLRERRGAAPLPEEEEVERPVERFFLYIRRTLRSGHFSRSERDHEEQKG